MNNLSSHTFHIPVLGLCFSIDTPLKVARYGISSVVSIIEDELIEHMRSYHCQQNHITFIPISGREPDSRAKRITSYLNMMQQIVSTQVQGLKQMAFTEGSDLSKYFEMLPLQSPQRKLYEAMLSEKDPEKQEQLQQQLREGVVAGAIDVNIMAKVDNAHYDSKGERLPDEYSDALSALRGFAQSDLSSSVVFSAGYNPRLYSYAEQFEDFFPDEKGVVAKKITLKVSDYRSALVQGKILAKKGLWISEFRIESGLNCGGHAFATEGLLMGPILEEFRQNKKALQQELFELCDQSLEAKGKKVFGTIPSQKITAQGGIGTAEEHEFLLSYFELDGAGWGSPFLLVPEATNVDDNTLQQLSTASKEDFYLSDASPLGVPFNNFRKSTSEAQRKARIEKKRAGSPCYKKYLSSNTEFTEIPICTASRQYMELKERQLKAQNLSEEELTNQLYKIAEKDCLCEGLTASVRLKNEMYLPHKMSAVAICPGPNLAYFSGIFSLKDMADHIYGRKTINNSLERPNMFINELQLYIDYLKRQIAESSTAITEKQRKYFGKFKANLQSGIEYYRALIPSFTNIDYNALQLSSLELQLSHLF
ncbi:MAG TPA: hypothetical protein VL093_06810 [Flavipsychrobacter sp.]|nr:hypothetical protein [Flavipsychrobacter sp.]